MKGLLRVILGSVLLIAISSTAHAQVFECTDSVSPAFFGTTTNVLFLSASDNAHAEGPGPTNYSVEVRCRISTGIGLSVSNSNTNPFIRLSSTTNAHAELNTETQYSVPLTITPASGTLVFQNVGPGQTCSLLDGAGLTFRPIVKLGASTNSHVQAPTSGTGNYGYTICGAYSPAGGSVPGNVILAAATTGIGFPITGPANGTVNVGITNSVLSDPNYTNVTTMQFTGICDTALPACVALDTYGEIRVEFNKYVNAQPNAFVSGSVQGTNYASTYPNSLGFPNASGLDGAALTNNSYDVDAVALGLANGTYRFFVLNMAARFTFIGTPGYTETPNSDNWGQYDFIVDITGGGTGSVDGGDVYLLRAIEFANVYTNADIVADVIVTNLQPSPETNTGTISVIVRKSDGSIVAPFDGSATWPVDFTSGNTVSVPVTIQDSSAVFLSEGETYTIYATIRPYQDLDGTAPDNSEAITANNSAFRTFTSITQPQAFSVPDAPGWMALVMMGLIMGWMFFATRKNE